MLKRTVYIVLIFSMVLGLRAQSRPDESVIQTPSTGMWLGVYGKFRISKKIFWDGQFHYRRVGHNDVPYVGRMGQIYNRHAVSYLVSPNFSASLGGVLRLNFTPDPGNPDFKNVVPEPRIWHEYLFAMPFSRFNIYHRIRIEHRWSVSNRIDADWIYRDRWRYKFYMIIPINKPKLIPGAFYFVPDVEIIMQSGKAVVDNPLEDLRIYPQIGYIANPRVKYGAGMMYTMGQTNQAGHIYNSRWVFRLNVYLSLDFRKFEEKIPEINIRD